MTLAFAVLDRSASCPAGAADELMSQFGVRICYAKNEEVYGQDEPADLVYQVTSGVVRTSRFMADGRRPVDDFYYPGDLFGLEAGRTHSQAAEALTDCTLRVASRAKMRAAGRDDDVAQLLCGVALREVANAREHLALLACRSAAERVGGFLQRIAERAASPSIDLAMSRQDMADYLGLTIETVSRTVSQFQAEGVIAFSSCRRFVIRDPAALRALAST